jgi:hypothetical protein
MPEREMRVPIPDERDGGATMSDDTREKHARAFAEWMRRYQHEPEQFKADWASMEADDYGTQCAKYFEKLLAEASVQP